MKRITAKDFQQAVKFDPAWASKLTETVEVTDYCNMEGSTITHLSPKLHFTGMNDNGESADFSDCKFLEIAEGNFEGSVTFGDSGIKKIGELEVSNPDMDGYAAEFIYCENLEVAEGIFNGFVNFDYTGVQRIGDLEITGCAHGDESKPAASFRHCDNLKIATGTYPGTVDFRNSGVEQIQNLNITPDKNGKKAEFEGCNQLKTEIPLTDGQWITEPNPLEAKLQPDGKIIHEITAEDFQRAVELDPAWALTLTEPVRVTGHCNMTNSDITHLSPLLHFVGTKNPPEEVADFFGCASLTCAEGTFDGSVKFTCSGIESIGELNITQPDEHGWAADFESCQNIKVARGRYPGFVNFYNSSIEKIGDLKITGTGTIDSPLNEESKFPEGTKLSLQNCDCLKSAPREFHGPDFLVDAELRAHSMRIIKQQDHAKKLLKTQPEIEI